MDLCSDMRENIDGKCTFIFCSYYKKHKAGFTKPKALSESKVFLLDDAL